MVSVGAWNPDVLAGMTGADFMLAMRRIFVHRLWVLSD